jgi:hypothetical protein
MYNLHFKWTVSRGRETYGYNICSLYVDGRKVSSCNGGGYDMKGTAFGNWVEVAFQDKLQELKLDPKVYYGLSFYKDKYHIDGACGFSSVVRIVEKLGYELVWNPANDRLKNDDFYTMIKK